MKRKNLTKRTLAVFLAVVMLIFSVPVLSFAGNTSATLTASATSGTFAKTLKWSFNKLTQKLTISGKGAIPNYDFDMDEDFNITVNTPWKKYNPISLEIKSGVTSIGDYAFAACTKIATLSVADSVKYVGEENFDSSIWLALQKSGAIYIGKCLYKYTGNSSSLKIKAGTVSISPMACAYTRLKSVTFPKGLKTIGDVAFTICEKLKTVSLPESVRTIGYGAFSGCSSLSSIKLNKGLTTIGESAFSGAEKVKSISIPSTVKKIGPRAFSGIPSLSKITVSSSNKYFSCDKKTVLFDKAKTKLIQFPVGSKLTSYKLPSTVKTIGSFAFSDAGSLSKIVLPSKLKTIEPFAFSGCSTLSKINFPSSIESANSIGIEDSNWYATRPIGIIYIGKVAYTYKGNMAKNTSIKIKKGITSIADEAFMFCDNLAKITLPSGLKSIGESAFDSCLSLKSITIPSSVKSIGMSAFSDCSSLTSVVIPAKVKVLEEGTFAGCEKLKSVKILNPLCKIESDESLFGSSGITDILGDMFITIPKKTKIIAYKGSPAQSYAKKNGNSFEALKPISVTKCSVAKIANQKYTGKALTPTVTVSYQGAKLKVGKQCTVSYKNNKKVGTATVTIKGNTKYGFTGTTTVKFKISK